MPVGVPKNTLPSVLTGPFAGTRETVLGLRRKTLTGTAYTLDWSDSGSFLYVKSTGAFTLSLGPPMDAFWVQVVNQADQNLVISTLTASTIVTFNNLTASSVTFSSASNRIGRVATITSDGALWFITYDAEGTLPTIA